MVSPDAILRKVIRLVGAAVLLVAAIIYFWTPARMAAFYAAGRTSVCPWKEVAAAPGHPEQIRQFKDEILAASRKIAEDGSYVQFATPDGNYWIPKGSEFVLPFNLAEQKRDIYTHGDIRVREGDIVLDCGANVGVFTRKALRAGAKTVVAIEPAPENIEVLKRNFPEEIAAGRVIVYPKGVWDKDDMLVLHVHPHNSAADSFVIEQKGSHESDQKLPLTTIDKLAGELNLERVNFIKMDIEGAEVRALNGARATIAKHHPRMALSSYHAGDHPVEIPKAVLAAWDGYRMECGPCADAGWYVRPDVLFFY